MLTDDMVIRIFLSMAGAGFALGIVAAFNNRPSNAVYFFYTHFICLALAIVWAFTTNRFFDSGLVWSPFNLLCFAIIAIAEIYAICALVYYSKKWK